MPNISDTQLYISDLQDMSSRTTLIMSILILLLGLVGNLLNCLVFAHRTLRSKPCVIYFLLASISNLIVIISGVTPRALQSFSLAPDLTETVPVFCKLRLIVLFTMRTISSWLLALATVDRYLISNVNVHRRRMSNLNNTYRWVGLVSISSLLIWAEVGYCFDANLIGTPQKCYAKSDVCRILNDLAQSFITTIIPSGVMLMFGLLTVQNVRQSLRLRPSNDVTSNNIARQNRKDEKSLTVMLIVQVILLTVFTFPQAGQKFYLTYTFYQRKSSTQRALESFLFSFVLLLTYIPSCIPFYIYTITGTLFRQTLFKVLKRGFYYFYCRC